MKPAPIASQLVGTDQARLSRPALRAFLNIMRRWSLKDDVACRLLDGESCRCRDYPNRHEKVSDCVALTPENVPELKWLPPTCAYRRLSEGKGLDWWHPLVSGEARTVVEAGVSVSGRVIPETEVAEEDLVEFMIEWRRPRRQPGRNRRKKSTV